MTKPFESQGAVRIGLERLRQQMMEGWSDGHDDDHNSGELAWAAVCYAAPEPIYMLGEERDELRFMDPWPADWASSWDKRPRSAHDKLRKPTHKERIRMLEKAGALIAAEIDRLLRLKKEK